MSISFWSAPAKEHIGHQLGAGLVRSGIRVHTHTDITAVARSGPGSTPGRAQSLTLAMQSSQLDWTSSPISTFLVDRQQAIAS